MSVERTRGPGRVARLLAAVAIALPAGCAIAEEADGPPDLGGAPAATAAGPGTTLAAVAGTAPAAPIPRRVLAVADSVMLGAVEEVEAIPGWDTTVDARGCRQPTWSGDGCGATAIPSGVDALRDARAAGLLGGVVVVHLGNNGPMSAEQLDTLLAEVADQRLVLVLTLHEPRSYEAGNNEVIRDAPQRWPRVRVVDWHGAATPHPEWFGDGEGIHLSDAGAQAMADLVAAHLPRP
jgi:hypothetical protein